MELIFDMITNENKEFYQLIGPFLGRREIEKEIGFQIYNKDGKVWFLAKKNDKVVGFCASEYRKNHSWFCSDYVISKYRNNGIYSALFNLRLHNTDGICKASCTNDSLHQFLKSGFSEVRKNGKYTLVELRR